MLKCMLFDYCVAGFVIVISLYKDKLFKNAIIKIGEMSFAIYLVEGYVINNRATLLYFLEDGLVRNVGCAVVVLMVGFAVHQIVNNCITENDIVAKRGET